MKKHLLLAICFFTALQFGFSQENRSTKGSGKNHQVPTSSSRKGITPNPLAAFWTDDFSNTTNWTISNQVGNNDDWVIGTGVPAGAFAIGGILSTTASNGFALYDSDLLCSGDQIADLTTANPINCTGKTAVTLSFEQYYRRFDDSTLVLVSTDNVNWTGFPLNTTVLNNQFCPGGTANVNPDIVTINISSVAANQATVWIRFEFYSPSSFVGPGGAPGCGYAWMIDDVSLSEPASVDGGVSAIIAPVSDCGLSATSQVTVAISNFGGSDITGFPVSMTLNGGTPITETFTGTITAGATANYTFTTTINLASPATYTINAYTTIATDGNSANDATSASVISVAPNDLTTPLTMDFEPGEDLSQWSTEDLNGDGVTWDLVALVNTFVQSGTQACRKAGSGAGAIPEDDDWLFTPCLELTAGTTYALNYWFKNFELVNPCSIETSIGTSPSGAAMTQSIEVNAIPSDTTYQNATPTFTVPANGVYYLGFHAYVPAGLGGSSSIRIDNINLSITTGINETKNTGGVSIYPNPSNGLVNLTVAKYANAKVQVLNSVGKVVYNENISSAENKIDLTKFTNGLYIVTVTSPEFTYTEKITLNK
jgi:hypothetical protein